MRTIDAIDAQGYDKAGQAVPNVPDEEALVKAVFASDVGVDNEPLSTKDGGTIWFEIANVDPARQLTFNEVKSKVADAWTDDEGAKELAAKADDDIKKLNGGETLAALAAETKLTVAHKDGIKRYGGTWPLATRGQARYSIRKSALSDRRAPRRRPADLQNRR